jgi:hypothetical protein
MDFPLTATPLRLATWEIHAHVRLHNLFRSSLVDA